MGGDDVELARLKCILFAAGSGMRVLMHVDVLKVFKSIPTKEQAKLLANAELMVEGHTLAGNQYNHNEGRTKGGRRLEALKVFKWRLYGFTCHLSGQKTCVFVDVAEKKTDKAGPKVLERARNKVDNFFKEFCND
jgi:hypothetical protein